MCELGELPRTEIVATGSGSQTSSGRFRIAPTGRLIGSQTVPVGLRENEIISKRVHCVRIVPEPSDTIGHERTQSPNKYPGKTLNCFQWCPIVHDRTATKENLKSAAAARALYGKSTGAIPSTVGA